MKTLRRHFKDCSKTVRAQPKDSSPIGYRGEGRGESTPHPSPSDTTYPDATASCGLSFSELMGVCREVFHGRNMGRNGSILKLMLRQGGCRELEAAIRGLRLVISGCESLRPLWTAKQRDGRRISEDVYGQAVQAWYQSQKTKTKPKETDEGMKPLDFSQYAGDAA